MNTKEWIRKLKEDSRATVDAMLQHRLSSRFLLGSHNSQRLRKSLGAAGRLDLAERTLLFPPVHQAHAKRLAERYLRKWMKIRDESRGNWAKLPSEAHKARSMPTDNDIAAEHYRFLTLVDSVTAVDAGSALKAAVKLKEKLTTTVLSVKGISCLCAIEVEVVSMKLMREFRQLDKTSDAEWRKLEVCETLAKNLEGTLYVDEESLFLIHLHGIVNAKKPNHFDIFLEKLKKVKAWSLAPRQIQLKALSTSFGNKKKTTEQNLKHISTYITKGGNDWYGNKAYPVRIAPKKSERC